MLKVKEEIGELERETGNEKREAIEDEVGDLLFAVVNLARKLGIEPNRALERANDKFTRRFEAMERLAERRGGGIGRASVGGVGKVGGGGKNPRVAPRPGLYNGRRDAGASLVI